MMEKAVNLVKSFLNSNLKPGTLTNPTSLTRLRHRAIRIGIWWRIPPLKRALIDVTIVYVRHGGVVRSPVLLNEIREIILEILTRVLARSLIFVATIVGRALMERTGREPRGKHALLLGIQWLNTPLVFRGG
jgi:hypothetical protein